ncbi:DUF3127 domain-containing protein [Marinoscillum sp. MHG1-6]|uniref:DUF3127 domain-containing protein n=1 Tax=Marinoscillum sp. MHG1-6 TaxID=2959627 RepID=UPI00215855BC|nr:DUF3127 domain-containing protein [Marinoscillum sp. MHG1-6]
MNIEGKLIEKFETQNVTESFKKREFVVEYADNPQYPEFLKFELIQNNCQQLDSFNVGDKINVNFNLKGRKWTNQKGETNYFNSLQAWRLEKTGSPEPSAPSMDTPPPPSTEDSWMDQSSAADDDLPF